MDQRILAIDDEVQMLKWLERIVAERTTYPIVTTNNALELPALLDEQQFDLIITDLRMPGLNGLDVLRHVKARGRGEEVVIITAFGSLETATEALAYGAFDYITKPFTKEQIITTVDRAMHRQRVRQEMIRAAGILELEPFERAQRAFADEYVRRLAQRCAGSREAMMSRSGLPAEIIDGARRDSAGDPGLSRPQPQTAVSSNGKETGHDR